MTNLLILLALTISANGLACSSNLTAQSTAEVSRVVLDRDRKTTKRKTSSNKTKKKTTTSLETEIDYRYTVNGRTYEGFSEKDGDQQRDFRPGSQVVVCYNPSNPEESDVFPTGYRCGS